MSDKKLLSDEIIDEKLSPILFYFTVKEDVKNIRISYISFDKCDFYRTEKLQLTNFYKSI